MAPRSPAVGPYLGGGAGLALKALVLAFLFAFWSTAPLSRQLFGVVGACAFSGIESVFLKVGVR